MCYCVLIRFPSLQLFSKKGCVGAWLVSVPDKPGYRFLCQSFLQNVLCNFYGYQSLDSLVGKKKGYFHIN